MSGTELATAVEIIKACVVARSEQREKQSDAGTDVRARTRTRELACPLRKNEKETVGVVDEISADVEPSETELPANDLVEEMAWDLEVNFNTNPSRKEHMAGDRQDTLGGAVTNAEVAVETCSCRD